MSTLANIPEYVHIFAFFHSNVHKSDVCFLLQGFDCKNISVSSVHQLHTKFGKLFEEDDIKVISNLKLPCDGDQKVKMFMRDIVHICTEWLSDADLADYMVFEPKVSRYK